MTFSAFRNTSSRFYHVGSVQIRRIVNGRISGLLAALFILHTLIAGSARAQCPGEWYQGPNFPGIDVGAYCMMTLSTGEVVIGGNFHTAGNAVASSIVLYNPTTGQWTSLNANTSSIVYAVAELPSGDILAAGYRFTLEDGSYAHYLARYSRTTSKWSAFGSNIEGFIFSLLVMPNGDVIAAGDLTSAGGIEVASIARYTPSTDTWAPLGSGVSGRVNALALLPDGDLIVGGAFTQAGGSPANHIARYDFATSSWSPLGLGTGRLVEDIAILPDGDLLVGGGFTSANGMSAKGVARYRPSTNTWSPLGDGVANQPGSYPLITNVELLPGGKVFLAGYFVTAGGLPASNVAIYDPATGAWTVPPGTNDVKCATVIPNGDIIVGATLSIGRPGGIVAASVARYTPATNTWSPLATGIDGGISRVFPIPNGDVWVVGSFTTIGGLTTNGRANYVPETHTWSHPNADFSTAIRTVAHMPDGSVAVGGEFTTIGGIETSNVARYTPATDEWSPLGAGLSGRYVSSLEALPSGEIIAAGNFTKSGNTPTYQVARYDPATDTWSQLGSGLAAGSSVHCLATQPNGNVFVAGDLRFPGVSQYPRGRGIARFDAASQTWSFLGTVHGNDEVITSLAVLPNGDLVAAGRFTIAGVKDGNQQTGIPAQHIARYRPSTDTWSTLGSSGIGRTVDKLLVLPNGDLIATGSFSTADGLPASGVARYRPATNTWHALGAGLSRGSEYFTVNSLTMLPDGDLLCSGSFTAAGGHVSVYFARYDFGNTLCPADMDCSGTRDVTDLFAYINAWLAKSSAADFNSDDAIDVADLFAFINTWLTGC